MSSKLLWKIALILVVVGGAAWLTYPPGEKINLGLDLQGGAHILMEVDTDSALVYERDLTLTRLARTFEDEGVVFEAVKDTGPATLEILGTSQDDREKVRDLLDRQAGGWEILDLGAGNWRVSMPQDYRSYITGTAIDTTLETLRNRVDGLGVKDPLIQPQGLQRDRILVQLPGVEDIGQVKDLIQEPALLEWKGVRYPDQVTNREVWEPGETEEETLAKFGGILPEDAEIYREDTFDSNGNPRTFYWPLRRVSFLIGKDLKNAVRGADQWNKPQVNFELTPDAAKRFQQATREYLKLRMAILLGNQYHKDILSVPVIQSEIYDRGEITGGFTVDSAEALAIKLRSGAMPTAVSIIEERTVGPSLGRDSIRAGILATTIGAGILATTIGFVCVLIFMVIYYRLSGINAVVALSLNIILVLGAMAFFDATLTLPGIAGLVLVVGMAVDSNVLIFERIREELTVGKTVRSAVEQGFGRAFMTILDCNVTTLVAAFFLFFYGTGPVKGFAVTLTIGLLSSMFTAVFVSRQLFELILGGKRRVESLSI
jgi:preprotein translocase subunit SecD